MPTHWTKLSTKKPVFIPEKQLNEENPGLKHTDAKWQPLWQKIKKVEDGRGTKQY